MQRRLLLVAVPLCALPVMGQTSTTYTGTLKDLTGAVVTSGRITWELGPPGALIRIDALGAGDVNRDGTLDVAVPYEADLQRRNIEIFAGYGDGRFESLGTMVDCEIYRYICVISRG